jgi:beta-mannanase
MKKIPDKLRRYPRIFAFLGTVAVLAIMTAGTASASPKTTLGIWTSAEDTSPTFVTVAGQHPNVANYYLGWGQPFPTAWAESAVKSGATPFIELEPWHIDGTSAYPSMVAIGAGAYNSYLATIGKAVHNFAHPVIFTFAHEFNVSGQYPWSAGDAENTTPAQWIKAWDTVESAIMENGGNHWAWWMWVPNADTGGTTQPFAAWWPGQHHVTMVGIDGYPQPQYGLNTFSEVFGQSFAEMRALTKLPVFIAETDIAQAKPSIGAFVSAMKADRGTGLLQFQDGTLALTAAQWAELDKALGAT